MSAPAIGGVLTLSQGYTAIFIVGAEGVLLSLLAGLFALKKGLPFVEGPSS